MFFYINNIIILYSKKNFDHFQIFKTALLCKFKIRFLNKLKWFLDI